MDISGFTYSQLPFTYLGVPMYAKKIPVKEGNILVEKMMARIRQWGSRNLSYAGRMVLINSVLLTIHTYWCHFLILPKSIIKSIIGVCRAFLWKGKEDFGGPGAVAWDKICLPKAYGGLGFRCIGRWNRAALFKQVWAVANKEDSLWLRWINHVYLKGDDI